MPNDSSTDPVDIVLITGPAGIGKSTLSWEVGARLTAAGLAHAIVETDELDRVYPRPSRADLERLRPGTLDISTLNLAAIWATYRALGHRRLIMSGVMVHLDFDRRWILAAIPDARITVVRLQASGTTLTERLIQREIGSGLDAQLERTLTQAQRMAGEAENGAIRLETDGRSPQELARLLLAELGWVR
ncbi:AAA family ATPase [Labrys sp. KNU-23]|uniref:AAA family ATPase n=1 Tax=Labrys sp. KNU-23 TaxID=2789216 RepID=UPI00165B3D98|nr:AAA family ATPase [Labrys sp. KNU-23]